MSDKNKAKVVASLTGTQPQLVRRTINYTNDPRFLDLTRKENHYRGKQYDDRAYDWNGKLNDSINDTKIGPNLAISLNYPDIPLHLRKPSTPYHMGRIVVNRFVALLCGENRFPYLSVPKDQETEDFLNEMAQQIHLKAHFTEAATIGGFSGSAIMAFKVVDGRFQLECFNPRWCTVIWEDFHNADMEAFSVSYPYSEQVYSPEKKKWITTWYLYRRIINKQADILFVPQEMDPTRYNEGILKDMNADPVIDWDGTRYHGLDFIPAVFMQNLPRYDSVDGDTDCEVAYDIFDRISEMLSGVHKGLGGNLDPTLMLMITPEDWKKLQSVGGVFQKGTDGTAIVLGDKGDGKYLEISGEGLKLAIDYVKEMRTYALEICDCIIADPHRISGAAQSAAAIAKLYAPMLAKTDMLRTQYGDKGIKKLSGKMLDAYHKLSDAVAYTDDGPQKMTFQPVERVDPETGDTKVVKPKKGITAVHIKLNWGAYFESTPGDDLAAIQTASLALGGKPVTTPEVAARYAAPHLKDNDVIRTVKQVQVAAEAAAKLETDQANAQVSKLMQPANKPNDPDAKDG